MKLKDISKRVSYELPEYPEVYFELGHIASDQKQAGRASFFLGKYNMYGGDLKQAEQNFKNALRIVTLPEKMKVESKELLKKIEKLNE